MIEIKISETGFVSGDAWERVAYSGEVNSRTIHTTHPFDVPDEDEVYGYTVRCHSLHKVEDIYLDEKSNVLIPVEFLANAGTLDLQFFIKVGTAYKMKSNMFSLFIEPSIEVTDCKLRKGAENFIVVPNMEERQKIPAYLLADGKVVKVNDIGNGRSALFVWNREQGMFLDWNMYASREYVDETVNKAIEDNKLRWEKIPPAVNYSVYYVNLWENLSNPKQYCLSPQAGTIFTDSEIEEKGFICTTTPDIEHQLLIENAHGVDPNGSIILNFSTHMKLNNKRFNINLVNLKEEQRDIVFYIRAYVRVNGEYYYSKVFSGSLNSADKAGAERSDAGLSDNDLYTIF